MHHSLSISMHKYLVMGDFNARVGNMDQGLKYIISDWGNVLNDRESRDQIVNPRGEEIMEFMNNYDMLLLNGRSPGDSPGNFTFSGPNGRSTIDLIFTNEKSLQYVESLKTVDLAHSNHFPVELKYKYVTRQCISRSRRLVWKDEMKEKYKDTLDKLLIECDVCSHEIMQQKVYEAASLCGMIQSTCTYDKPKSKWFRGECIEQRKKLKHVLSQAKISQSVDEWHNYHDEKRKYHDIIKKSKRRYDKEVRMGLLAHNKKQFWNSVKTYRGKGFTANKVKEDAWLQFYKNILPARETDHKRYEGNECDELDRGITLSELDCALKKIPLKKACGTDGIPNEFLKNMPELGRKWLLELLNLVLVSEKVPTQWTEAIVHMLHKKGDTENPANYRPISLLNHMYKLFSQIVHERLSKWAEENGLLPEAQNGFRKNRSTDEQIYSLTAAIQLNTHKKGKRVYALFVDFERAFSSVPHEKLWKKLHWLGVSGKMIRILKYMYENSSMKIKTENGYTSKIDLTEGVTQGDLISPLVFNLFISDIESFLNERTGLGVKITHKFNLKLLAFADDMIIFASTKGEMQRKINALREYFIHLGLKVNVSKTKIMVFRKGGKLEKNLKFWYGTEEVEIVSSFKYLGVTFYPTGSFTKTINEFCKKGNAAIGSLWKVILGGKMTDWFGKWKLFDSIVANTTLYASQIWGLKGREALEKVQGQFNRRLLRVSRYVPNHVLRTECGRLRMSFHVVKKALKFWHRLLLMEDYRYPKKCFLAQLQEINSCKDSWVGEMRSIFEEFGQPNLLNEQNPAEFLAGAQTLLQALADSNRIEDISRIKNSSRFSYYEHLLPNAFQPAEYILKNLTTAQVSTFSQLRLNGDILFLNGVTQTFSNEICKICERSEDSFHHFIFECAPICTFKLIRQKFSNLSEIQKIIEKKLITSVYYYVSGSLILRSKILEEFNFSDTVT